MKINKKLFLLLSMLCAGFSVASLDAMNKGAPRGKKKQTKQEKQTKKAQQAPAPHSGISKLSLYSVGAIAQSSQDLELFGILRQIIVEGAQDSTDEFQQLFASTDRASVVKNLCLPLSTLLMDAAEHNRVDIVRLLLDQGADLFVKNINGKSVFDFASQNNEVMNLLFDEVIKQNKRALLPDILVNAAFAKNDLCIEVAIQKGINMHICDDKGADPLNTAIEEGAIDIVKKLWEAGGCFAIKKMWEQRKRNPLLTAWKAKALLEERGHPNDRQRASDIVDYFAQQSFASDLLMLRQCVSGANQHVINYFNAYSAQVGKNQGQSLKFNSDEDESKAVPAHVEPDSQKQRAIKEQMSGEMVKRLMASIEEDNAEQFKKLVKFAQLNNLLDRPINDRNQTLLMLAVELGRVEMVHVLVQAGAKPLVVDTAGLSAMDHATVGEMRDDRRINMLRALSGMASFDIKQLFELRIPTFCKIVSDNGIDEKTRAERFAQELQMLDSETIDFVISKSRATLLHLAGGRGRETLVRQLLEKGANPCLEMINGANVFMCVLSDRATDIGKKCRITALLFAKVVSMEHQNVLADILTGAVAQDNQILIQEAIKSGVNLFVKNAAGYDPLTLAIKHNKLDMVRMLWESGRFNCVEMAQEKSHPLTAAVIAAGQDYKGSDLVLYFLGCNNVDFDVTGCCKSTKDKKVHGRLKELIQERMRQLEAQKVDLHPQESAANENPLKEESELQPLAVVQPLAHVDQVQVDLQQASVMAVPVAVAHPVQQDQQAGAKQVIILSAQQRRNARKAVKRQEKEDQKNEQLERDGRQAGIVKVIALAEAERARRIQEQEALVGEPLRQELLARAVADSDRERVVQREANRKNVKKWMLKVFSNTHVKSNMRKAFVELRTQGEDSVADAMLAITQRWDEYRLKLSDAARNNNIDYIKELHNQFLNDEDLKLHKELTWNHDTAYSLINARDDEGNTPLLLAVMQGNFKFAHTLLSWFNFLPQESRGRRRALCKSNLQGKTVLSELFDLKKENIWVINNEFEHAPFYMQALKAILKDESHQKRVDVNVLLQRLFPEEIYRNVYIPKKAGRALSYSAQELWDLVMEIKREKPGYAQAIPMSGAVTSCVEGDEKDN